MLKFVKRNEMNLGAVLFTVGVVLIVFALVEQSVLTGFIGGALVLAGLVAGIRRQWGVE